MGGVYPRVDLEQHTNGQLETVRSLEVVILTDDEHFRRPGVDNLQEFLAPVLPKQPIESHPWPATRRSGH
jgi:hypothetical protein